MQNFILKQITIIQANETRNHDEQSKEVSNIECGFHIVYDEEIHGDFRRRIPCSVRCGCLLNVMHQCQSAHIYI